MQSDAQNLLPDQVSRPTDFELLQACGLVTEIPNYFCASRYPNLELFNMNKVLATPSNKRLRPEVPGSLHTLREYEWELVFASHWEGGITTQNDYQGIILINRSSQTILLVHRGMQFTPENLSEALLIALAQTPEIANDAIAMCNIALDLVRRHFPTFTIRHTGFSMGGFLAQVTAAYCNNTDEHQRHQVCICFDPPGAADAIRQLGYRNNRTNTFVYVTAPNAVTTATPHYGYVRQIASYAGQNPYRGVLRPFFVNAATEIDTRQALPKIKPKNARRIEALFELGRLTFLYHDQDKLREDLGNSEYFKFSHVHSWPLATNRLRHPRDERPVNDPVDYSDWKIAALDIGVEVVNHVLYEKSTHILNRSGLTGHHFIQHQVINPLVVHSATAHLTEATPQVPELIYLGTAIIMAVILEVQREKNRARYTRRRTPAENLSQLRLNTNPESVSSETRADARLEKSNNSSNFSRSL